MLFGVFSNNPIEPFLNANTMQIIVIAVFAGSVMLTVREKVPKLCSLVDEMAAFMQALMSWVCKLIPVFVFASLLKQIWTGTAGEMLGLWKPVCLYLAELVIITLVILVWAAYRVKVIPFKLLRVFFSPFAVALSTASSMAAYSISVETCKQKLGLDKSLVDFAFPIGIVMYMPGTVITFAVLAGYLSGTYQIEVNISWLIMAWILSAVLAIAVPPIPGAMMTCCGILMSQLGIPAEGLLLAAAFDIVEDFVSSGFAVLILGLELVRQGVKLGKYDPKKLQMTLSIEE